LQKQYDTVSTTRFNQLVRRVDRVKLEGATPEEEQKILDFVKEEE
jgi:hypothetical protein